MNDLTTLIKNEIKRQYKSARQFALSIGIPPTTLASTLKNGVEGTSYDTIIKICKALDIRFLENSIPIKMSEDSISFIKKYNSLDTIGKHTIDTVLLAEYNRCNEQDYGVGLAAAFGGKQNKTKLSLEDTTAAHKALKKHIKGDNN